MAVVSQNYLVEAGVHFGHQTKRWNPKMKEYIFGTREDIYIIDLEKTKTLLEEAYNELKTIAANGGKILFVGTKKQASEVCVEEAVRSNSYYVTQRWLGGTLTNFRTIRRRVKRLEEIENMEKNGTFEKLPKKEVIGIKKEYEKLNGILGGIREMFKIPSAIVVIDPKKEYNAIMEARKLKIPVFGLVDTNADPDLLDYVIPGNDASVKSIKVILGVLNNAICEATNLELVDYASDVVNPETLGEDLKEEKTFEKKERRYNDRKYEKRSYDKKNYDKSDRKTDDNKSVNTDKKTDDKSDKKVTKVKKEDK